MSDQRMNEEYRKYINDDTPDYWQRIQDGIERADNGEKNADNQVVSFEQAKQEILEENKKIKINKKSILSIVATAAVLGISVNIFHNGTFKSESAPSATATESFTAAGESYSETPASEPNLVVEEEYAPEMEEMDTAPAEEYEYEESAPAETFTNDEAYVSGQSDVNSGKREFGTAKAESDSEDILYSGEAANRYASYRGGEEYDKEEEIGFLSSKRNPLSTFSSSVNTASYANARRMIEQGYSLQDIWYNSDAIRPEEFVNYFSYDLNAPKRGEKFGITKEVGVCPWNPEHDLMMIGVQAEDINNNYEKPNNFVFLVDVSGSMRDENKLPLFKKSLEMFLGQMSQKDTISIVTYSGDVDVIIEGATLKEKTEILTAIDSLKAGGSTNGERGMELAYDVAAAYYMEDGNNRIIMATDGDLNVGISDPEELKAFITEKRDMGIYLSVLGFGDGNLKDNNLSALADNGNGNYSYIDSVYEANKVLVKEKSGNLEAVAKDVKLQVEFNPYLVQGYRLIGYENKMMTEQDFDDVKKDAGEMGKGQSVVALYEIIPAGRRNRKLKYQQGNDEEVVNYTDDQLEDYILNEYATVTVRYKDVQTERLGQISREICKADYLSYNSENFGVASMAAEFALVLSDSPYKGEASLENILNDMADIKNRDTETEEFYYLVRSLNAKY